VKPRSIQITRGAPAAPVTATVQPTLEQQAA